MIDYLLRFYRKGSKPFQSLSSLPDERACALTRALYIEGSVIWERFKDPEGYLCFRRRVERQLGEGFVRERGRPKQDYPIYLVLGRPKWTEIAADAKIIEKGPSGRGLADKNSTPSRAHIEAQVWNQPALYSYYAAISRKARIGPAGDTP